jgi:small-conductance mechanosensitive channel
VNSVTFVKGVSLAALAALMLYYHSEYIDLTSQLGLIEVFQRTLFKVLLVFVIMQGARLLIIGAYRLNNPVQRKDNFTIGISHLSKILTGLLAGILALAAFDISFKEAITTLSLIAAAVVLITKDYISNLINGMYLTFAKVINIGDQVQIDALKGKITDITLTNVHLLNDDDDIIYIPNNKVFSSEIINYTRRELKKTSLDFEIEARKAPHVDSLENEIRAALKTYEDRITPNSINLKVQSIKFEYVQFKLQYVLRDPLNKESDKEVKKFAIRFLVKKISELPLKN